MLATWAIETAYTQKKLAFAGLKAILATVLVSH
jgi:hypothetical protein